MSPAKPLPESEVHARCGARRMIIVSKKNIIARINRSLAARGSPARLHAVPDRLGFTSLGEAYLSDSDGTVIETYVDIVRLAHDLFLVGLGEAVDDGTRFPFLNGEIVKREWLRARCGRPEVPGHGYDDSAVA